MQRCQLASGYTSAIALTSPAWSSLVTHLTPSTPRRRSPSGNARHDPPGLGVHAVQPDEPAAPVRARGDRRHHGPALDPAVRPALDVGRVEP